MANRRTHLIISFRVLENNNNNKKIWVYFVLNAYGLLPAKVLLVCCKTFYRFQWHGRGYIAVPFNVYVAKINVEPFDLLLEDETHSADCHGHSPKGDFRGFQLMWLNLTLNLLIHYWKMRHDTVNALGFWPSQSVLKGITQLRLLTSEITSALYNWLL